MTNLTLYSPFDRFFHTLENLDNAFYQPPSNFRVDIEEDNDSFRINAELPGIDKKNVAVNVEDNLLSINADFSRETNPEAGKTLHSERVSGNFRRSFRLPDNVDTADIGAEMKDGILVLRLPKSGKEEDAKRRIEVK